MDIIDEWLNIDNCSYWHPDYGKILTHNTIIHYQMDQSLLYKV